MIHRVLAEHQCLFTPRTRKVCKNGAGVKRMSSILGKQSIRVPTTLVDATRPINNVFLLLPKYNMLAVFPQTSQTYCPQTIRFCLVSHDRTIALRCLTALIGTRLGVASVVWSCPATSHDVLVYVGCDTGTLWPAAQGGKGQGAHMCASLLSSTSRAPVAEASRQGCMGLHWPPGWAIVGLLLLVQEAGGSRARVRHLVFSVEQC